MKKYDVVALGELLIDFTENGKSVQGNLYSRQIREGLLVTFWPCYQSLDIRPLLSVRWEMIFLVSS